MPVGDGVGVKVLLVMFPNVMLLVGATVGELEGELEGEPEGETVGARLGPTVNMVGE